MSGMALILGALPVEVAGGQLLARVRKLEPQERSRQVRKDAGPDWVAHLGGGKVRYLPLTATAKPPPNTTDELLDVGRDLGMVAGLVNDALIRKFSIYAPIRWRPFTFVGKRKDMDLTDTARSTVDGALLDRFHVRPRYVLDARVMEVRNCDPFVGLAVDVSTRWEITAGLHELQDAGIELAGLYVVYRSPPAGQPRLAGRVGTVDGGMVRMVEGRQGLTEVPVDAVMLEGRADVFRRCLQRLLGHRDCERFMTALDRSIGDLLRGPPRLAEVRRIAGTVLADPLPLTHGMDATFGEPIIVDDAGRYRSVVRARGRDYVFDPARTKRHQYAWPGLERHGPFSRDTFARPAPTILVLCPEHHKGSAETFVHHLRDGIPGTRFEGGMTNTFRLVNPSFDLLAVPTTEGSPEKAYRTVIEEILARGAQPDAAIVVLDDQHADLPDAVNPYLHTKAVLLVAGIATQHVKVSKIMSPPKQLAYILQNISIALYAKLNGVPWTVEPDRTIADELVIGIGSAELSTSRFRERQRHVGITTVFRGDGNYLLGQLSRETSWEDYPTVLRDSTMAAIAEVKARNGWQPGDTVRIVLHSARAQRDDDLVRLMHEAATTAGDGQHIEFAFLTVGHRHPFAVFDPSQQGKAGRRGTKGELVPARGLIVQDSRYSRLVTTTGPHMVKRPELPLPRPLRVQLHRRSTFKDLHYLSEQVLKFTGLSWRSTLPSNDPVTIFYSELIAGHLARLNAIPGWSPMQLNARLKASKWFL